jgi:hypothetical protein
VVVDNGGNMEFPFKENIKQGIFERTFSQDVDNDELVWHRDREDREVEVVGETNWMFQFDNELPFIMEEKFIIPMGVYHRVIKGDGELKLKIKKF